MIHKNKYFDQRLIASKYIQRFLGLNSAADMLNLKLFPNAKEVGESMAMFYAVTEKIKVWDKRIKQDSNNVNIVVVGDGVSPRTACLFNFLTKWNTWSIDPNMRLVSYDNVKRLTVIPDKIENVKLQFDDDQIVIIILPHSHAPVFQCWDNIQANQKWLIKMPCCTHDNLNFPGYYYRDPFAITAKNEIYIWSNYKTLVNAD